MEGKIAVLGSADFVMPFAALGLDTFAVSDRPKEAIECARTIVEGAYVLIVIAENIAPLTEEVFQAEQNKPIPGIVVVPFTTESEGFATKSLGEVLKLATGIDIFQSN